MQPQQCIGEYVTSHAKTVSIRTAEHAASEPGNLNNDSQFTWSLVGST